MTTMLEKLARAAVESIRADDRTFCRVDALDDLTDVLIDGEVDFTLVVRAILTELREPSKAQLDAALPYMDSYSSNIAWWQVMIDEILKEGQ